MATVDMTTIERIDITLAMKNYIRTRQEMRDEVISQQNKDMFSQEIEELKALLAKIEATL